MIIRLFLVAAVAASLLSCRSIDCTNDLSRENFSITITKGACMGRCPVYDGTVRGDQSIEYMGRMDTEREGVWSGRADEGTLCDIRTLIDENFVMSMKQDQMSEVQDAPATTLSITYKGETRMIRWNLGTPEGLKELVTLMIQLTHENTELTQGPARQD